MSAKSQQLQAPLPQVISWHATGNDIAKAQMAATPLVAAIGNFDGVHKGHQHLIAAAKTLAVDLGLPLAILTFSPHPRAFFRPQDPPFMIMDEIQKHRVLSSYGADIIVNITFDEALRVTSPEAFVQNILKPLQIVHLFAGVDFAFGRARAGTIETLAMLGKDFGMQATGVSLAKDDNQIAISSTRIRAALQSGQVALAQEMLSRPYKIAGLVAQGDQRGRTIGFPTANIEMKNQLHPAFGVYAITACLFDPDGANSNEGVCYDGVANIGIRPTVNNRGVLAEAHLFDFNDDIYGQRIEIALKGYVRAEMKFENLAALKDQIGKDTQTAKEILA